MAVHMGTDSTWRLSESRVEVPHIGERYVGPTDGIGMRCFHAGVTAEGWDRELFQSVESRFLSRFRN